MTRISTLLCLSSPLGGIKRVEFTPPTEFSPETGPWVSPLE